MTVQVSSSSFINYFYQNCGVTTKNVFNKQKLFARDYCTALRMTDSKVLVNFTGILVALTETGVRMAHPLNKIDEMVIPG